MSLPGVVLVLLFDLGVSFFLGDHVLIDLPHGIEALALDGLQIGSDALPLVVKRLVCNILVHKRYI